MIFPTGPVRVMVATKPVDFRKGMDGLAALVKEELGTDPFSGVVYVFRARRADSIKMIFWGWHRHCVDLQASGVNDNLNLTHLGAGSATWN